MSYVHNIAVLTLLQHISSLCFSPFLLHINVPFDWKQSSELYEYHRESNLSQDNQSKVSDLNLRLPE